jgi:hypothetical protein
MAEHQIVCVQKLAKHRHITHVGTGPSEALAEQRWTVAQVRDALEDGDVFYTVSPSTNHVALVEAYDAHVDGRVIETIRSSPDAIFDNNLDNLRACRYPTS